jgi:hypothetical protein
MSIGLDVLADEKRDHLGPANLGVCGRIVRKHETVLLQLIRVARLYRRPELKLPKPSDRADRSQPG